MQATGVPALDTTIQKTNIWIKEVMDELGTGDRHFAYIALRSVLHTLRDRLTAQGATDLGAQLPMLIRGFYYDDWNPAGKPYNFDRDEFVSIVNHQLTVSDNGAEDMIKAVFRVLDKHIAEGEIDDIKASLPPELVSFWENGAAID